MNPIDNNSKLNTNESQYEKVSKKQGKHESVLTKKKKSNISFKDNFNYSNLNEKTPQIKNKLIRNLNKNQNRLK